MSIKAIFPAGVEALTVHGLHQWDYGQKLEITHPDLPAVVEVHFSAVGAQDAIVRVGNGTAGVLEVSIPDELLEQSRPILAWVYVVGETSGTTMLTVTMPLQARARPTAAGPVPAPVADQYTQAVGAMNAAVESVRGGGVVVAKALEADHAAAATTAQTATTAGHATTADTASKATEADSAKTASKDVNGNYIASTYVTKNREAFEETTTGCAFNGLHQYRVRIGTTDYFTVVARSAGQTTVAALGVADIRDGDGTYTCTLTLIIGTDGTLTVSAYNKDCGKLGIVPDAIYHRAI